MPPHPKRKLSRGKQGRRRSHLGLERPNLIPCPQCHTLREPHSVCPQCGTYRGEQVVKVEEES